MPTIIKVENLSKRYALGEAHTNLLSERMGIGLRTFYRKVLGNGSSALEANTSILKREKDFWALKEVNFEVRQGGVVGIIGRNGAGKSTLLKILSKITPPTSGRVEMFGRVASLLEVGTGFHPELTGRENIFLNGAILGMSKAEIRKKFDEIVAFAEVEKFIDTPVKRYSSGMYVRLAFAVAAHLEPEILIVDEVLAVGDAAFQKKCLGKMGEVAKEGRTVLFVSHNMGAVQNLCDDGLLLNNGNLITIGKVSDVINQYLLSLGDLGSSHKFAPICRSHPTKLQIINFRILSRGSNHNIVQSGEAISFEITYHSIEKLYHLRAHIVIDTLYGEHILYLGTDMVAQDFDNPPSEGRIVCTLPECPLVPGQYSLSVHCVANRSELFYDEYLNVTQLHVVESDYFGSGKLPPENYAKILVCHEWGLAVD